MDYEFLLEGINKIEKIQEEQTIAITMLQGYIFASKTMNEDKKSSSSTQTNINNKYQKSKQVPAVLTQGEEMRQYKGKTIKKRADGRWWTRYYKNGKQYSVYGKTAEECLQNFKKALSGKTKQQKEMPKSITLDEWLNKWLQLYKTGQVRETTMQKIQGLLKAVDIDLKNKPICAITSLELQEFLNSIEHERKREQVYVSLKDAFTKAYKNKVIKDNPFDVVTVPKAKRQRKIRALTLDEERKFVEACKNNKFGSMFLLCLYQGLRLGEALALTGEDVDIEKMTLTVNKSLNGDCQISAPKTETSNRTMPLFKRSLDVIPKVECDQLLFNITTRKYYQKQMHMICEKLGLENVSVHTLRHTFATRCSEAGVPPKVVQQWLGHTTLEMTMNVYTHVNAEEEKKQARKFDTYFDTQNC